MAVTIWDGGDFNGDSYSFPIGYTNDLSNYVQPDGEFWDDDISSLYTSSYLYVYTGDNYTGEANVLAPGYHDVASLEYYIGDNAISSFRIDYVAYG